MLDIKCSELKAELPAVCYMLVLLALLSKLFPIPLPCHDMPRSVRPTDIRTHDDERTPRHFFVNLLDIGFHVSLARYVQNRNPGKITSK
uniref:Putative secreted protein n=1 Tax=Anopheles darlingi TaxID=43151 RepID=A0A2M4DH42_ANODA